MQEAADAELQTLREENYRLQQEALQEQARLSKLKETAEAEARQLRAEREQVRLIDLHDPGVMCEDVASLMTNIVASDVLYSQLQAQLASQAEAEAARQKQAAQNVINNQLDSVQAPGGDANAAAAPGQTADATSKTCTIM